MTRRPALPLALFAATATAMSMALFWPGVATFDTVAQYGQVLSGAYDDWHPPAMARWWSLIAPSGPGATPMLVMQLCLYWLGLGMLGAALASTGRIRAGAAVLGIGLWPVFLGWQGVVLKDTQMVGALVAATGLVGWWRLRGRAVPVLAVAGAGVLIGYATAIRANAVFATVPLAVALLPGWSLRRRVTAGLLATGAVLMLSPVLNHRLLGAAASGVERTEAIYDLAGIAVRVEPGDSHVGLNAAETREVMRRGCSRPYFWDPLGEPARCDATVERLRRVPVGALYATLADAVLHHPIAYAAHRLRHLNSTERWLVPWRWPGASPPTRSEPNDLGLGEPGRAIREWQAVVAPSVETPAGWPIVWVVLAGTGLAIAARGSLAAALFVSALTQEASFAVLSIASDLRYHLWAMIATALGLVMLAGRRPFGRAGRVGGAVLAMVVIGGLVARTTLPLPPQTYAGMLG